MGSKLSAETGTPHEHIFKVVKWGVNRESNNAEFYVDLWGCTLCDWTQANTP